MANDEFQNLHGLCIAILAGFIEKQNKTFFFFITLSILIPRKHNQMQNKLLHDLHLDFGGKKIW